MTRALLVLALLLSTAASAEHFSCVVADASGLSPTQTKRVQRAIEVAVKGLTGLVIDEGSIAAKSAPRACGDDCGKTLASAASSSVVAIVEAKALEGKGDKVGVEISLWLDGSRFGRAKRFEAPLDGFDAQAKTTVEALLPPWTRRGWGALLLKLDTGAVVKIDGRLSNATAHDTWSLPAGTHAVDVVFADGHALLQRVEVAEAARTPFTAVSPATVVDTSGPKRAGALRATAYGLWVVGMATVAGGLVAGALSRGTADGLTPCRADTRDCPTLDMVQERNRQAQAYADTGNVLLAVGAGLAAIGVGAFVVDVVTP